MIKFERFLPITKVDEEERMVYGWATTPDLDSDGEVITLESVEKALPGYMQFPTIREMHQPKAAGKTISAEIKNNKNQKGLYIGAKIVSEDAWALVKEGVYSAFSIGGNVLKKVNNVIHELELVEISLVDVPANKSAVIELWKREGGDNMKTQLKKDAEGVYSLTQIMIQLKDYISYCKWKGKNCKPLMKVLEQLKGEIATEAQETEAEAQANMEALFAGKTSLDLQKKITALEAMEMEDPMADALRKGVIIAMTKEADELKKSEEAAESEAKADEATAEEGAAETEETTETTPEPAEESEQEKDGEKEAGAKSTLEKVADLDKELDSLTPTEKAETVEKMDLAKSVNAMAGTLGKVVDLLKSQEARIKQLESTPAATKSKSTLVFKNEAEKAEKGEAPAAKQSGELAAKKERLAELSKKRDTMSPNDFAKAGLSKEASKLMNEIEQLEASAS